MYPVPTYLKNYELVRSAFGYLPCFHDATVTDFRYSLDGEGRIELTLHAFTMTAQLDERRFFVLTNHHLVHFAFQGIPEPQIDTLMGRGNILGELEFSSVPDFEAAGYFKVVIESGMGDEHSGQFLARSGEVVEVIRCDPEGNTPPTDSAD